MARASGRVVVVRAGHVALIRREREGATYYVFPGGGVEEGETFEAAAVREAFEELGVRVRLGALLLILDAPDGEQRYCAAQVTGGTFGTGTGVEFTRGRYTLVWMPIEVVTALDPRPREVWRTLTAVGRIIEPPRGRCRSRSGQGSPPRPLR